jgi:beta-lysine 5,6-aminomutase alpha subunit
MEFKDGGIIQSRAQKVLGEAVELLEEVEDRGMFDVLAEGVFADVFRPKDRGKGLDGVFERAPDYYNPIERELRQRTGLSVD